MKAGLEKCKKDMDTLTKLDYTKRLDERISDIRREFEDENELIGKFVRESKDKMGEMTRKFTLAFEKLTSSKTGIGISTEPTKLLDESIDTNQRASEPRLSINKGRVSSPEGRAKLTTSPGVIGKKSKVNAEVFEAKMTEFDNALIDIENHMHKIDKDFVEFKAKTTSDITKLMDEKVWKADFHSFLPTEEQQTFKIVKLAKAETEIVQDKLQQALENWDQKMIKLRKDFDINKITKMISLKAEKEEFNKLFENHHLRLTAQD